jgi:Peptidase family M23
VSRTEYDIRVRPTGFYADAVYDKTVFGLELQSPAPAKVTGLTGVHPTIPASASFSGRGYKPTANGGTGPRTDIAQNEVFALWPRDTYGWNDILFPMFSAGVDHYAGLMWPSVVGKRSGQPFRYATTLPDIVTDRLAICAGTEDCFYKPPWPLGVEYGTGQGNGPGFSHNGNQLYAFDFSVPLGGQLVAARGGVVGDVVENLSKNYNPCVDEDADGPANYVRIDHEDGTFGYYAHLKKDTVPLTVGQWVERGDPVGEAGNTGRSCGPHLHFQSSVTSASTYYGQTLRIRFNTLLEGGDTPVDCYIPLTGDALTSTNG